MVRNFQTQSTREKTAPKNAWVLVRSAEDGIHGPDMSEGVEEFVTGFENATPESLQDFVQSNCAPGNTYPNFQGEISSEVFIVLDAQSAKDNTCLLYFYYQPTSQLADEEEDDEEGVEYYDSTEPEWKSWRVKFLSAWHLHSSLWFNPSLLFELFSEGDKNYYVDQKGVLQFAGLEQTGTFDPPLDEEEKVPYGPVSGGTIAA